MWLMINRANNDMTYFDWNEIDVTWEIGIQLVSYNSHIAKTNHTCDIHYQREEYTYNALIEMIK